MSQKKTKMSLKEFMADDSLGGGSWADDDIDISSISVPIQNHSHDAHDDYRRYHRDDNVYNSRRHNLNNFDRDQMPRGGSHYQFDTRGPPPELPVMVAPPFIAKFANLSPDFSNDLLTKLFNNYFDIIGLFPEFIERHQFYFRIHYQQGRGIRLKKFKLFWELGGIKDTVAKKVAFVEFNNILDLNVALMWQQQGVYNHDIFEYNDYLNEYKPIYDKYTQLEKQKYIDDKIDITLAQFDDFTRYKNSVESQISSHQRHPHGHPTSDPLTNTVHSRPAPAPAPAKPKPNPFANAKPVDTLSKELQLEKLINKHAINPTTFHLGLDESELDENKEKPPNNSSDTLVVPAKQAKHKKLPRLVLQKTAPIARASSNSRENSVSRTTASSTVSPGLSYSSVARNQWKSGTPIGSASPKPLKETLKTAISNSVPKKDDPKEGLPDHQDVNEVDANFKPKLLKRDSKSLPEQPVKATLPNRMDKMSNNQSTGSSNITGSSKLNNLSKFDSLFKTKNTFETIDSSKPVDSSKINSEMKTGLDKPTESSKSITEPQEELNPSPIPANAWDKVKEKPKQDNDTSKSLLPSKLTKSSLSDSKPTVPNNASEKPSRRGRGRRNRSIDIITVSTKLTEKSQGSKNDSDSDKRDKTIRKKNNNNNSRKDSGKLSPTVSKKDSGKLSPTVSKKDTGKLSPTVSKKDTENQSPVSKDQKRQAKKEITKDKPQQDQAVETKQRNSDTLRRSNSRKRFGNVNAHYYKPDYRNGKNAVDDATVSSKDIQSTSKGPSEKDTASDASDKITIKTIDDLSTEQNRAGSRRGFRRGRGSLRGRRGKNVPTAFLAKTTVFNHDEKA